MIETSEQSRSDSQAPGRSAATTSSASTDTINADEVAKLHTRKNDDPLLHIVAAGLEAIDAMENISASRGVAPMASRLVVEPHLVANTTGMLQQLCSRQAATAARVLSTIARRGSYKQSWALL